MRTDEAGRVGRGGRRDRDDIWVEQRLKVDAHAPPAAPEALPTPVVRAASRRWGFAAGAGGTRVWAEPSDRAEERGDRDVALRAGVPAAATDVHVVPNERSATWQVYDARIERRLSEHASETEAEAAAHACARGGDGRRVVIHDRYHRTHEAAPASAERRPE